MGRKVISKNCFVTEYSLQEDLFDYAELRVSYATLSTRGDEVGEDHKQMILEGWVCYEEATTTYLEKIMRFRRLKC